MEPELMKRSSAAAARDQGITNAAREALRRRAGLAAIAKWEKQHGSFSTEEMMEARRSVGAQLRKARKIRPPA
jgi:hypothetical protein